MIVPRITSGQLSKRAELIHKDLTAKCFELGNEALSFQVSVGVAALVPQNGQKSDQDALYSRFLEALDKAKMQGNHIKIISES